jgi:hypothetical protein
MMLKKALAFVILVVATGCGGGSAGPGGAGGSSGLILLSPNGTASKPIDESISEPFILSATEAGYSGNFTARKVSGECFKVQPPAVSSGYWTIAPDGLYCIGGSKGDTEEFQVTDSYGHSAITYIHTI